MAAELPTAKSQLHSRPASFVPFTSEQKELETAYRAQFADFFGFAEIRNRIFSVVEMLSSVTAF